MNYLNSAVAGESSLSTSKLKNLHNLSMMSATNLKKSRVGVSRGKYGASMVDTQELIVNSSPDLQLKVPLDQASQSYSMKMESLKKRNLGRFENVA